MKERKSLFQYELYFSGSSTSESLGLYILENLLLLSGRESDPTVSQIIAKCLGEIGAIDPAKVPFVINAARISSWEINNTNYKKHQNPPWQLTPYEFSLILIEIFLVPRLRLRDNAVNAPAQDRICYSIQVLIHFSNSFSFFKLILQIIFNNTLYRNY